MLLREQELDMPGVPGEGSLIDSFREAVTKRLQASEVPVRFAVTRSDAGSYHCETGVLADADGLPRGSIGSLFEFRPRSHERTDKFTVVLLVPTGIGAEIGGHAGDAAPVARLLASACDTLITHPNVVNASDINELPDNGLYVEGSVICRFLMGTVGLERVRANRVLLVIDEHKDSRLSELSINSASAARAALGLDCPRVVKMDPPIRMRARYSDSGCAVGRVEGLEHLCEVLKRYRSQYDAVALASVIDVPEAYHKQYFESHGEMVNPWGGVEAMLTHAVSMIFNVPSAHSPMLESWEIANMPPGIVDPRISAEAVSTCFLHCVLKGLHRSPKIITNRKAMQAHGVLNSADISCLIIPDGCVGLPTLAAMEQGIPVIAVRENRNLMRNDLTQLPFEAGKLFIMDNYLEAAGVMAALRAGVAVPSVRRPLAATKVTSECAAEQLSVQSGPVDGSATQDSTA